MHNDFPSLVVRDPSRLLTVPPRLCSLGPFTGPHSVSESSRLCLLWAGCVSPKRTGGAPRTWCSEVHPGGVPSHEGRALGDGTGVLMRTEVPQGSFGPPTYTP